MGSGSPAGGGLLVLGAGGMLGHKLIQRLSVRDAVVGTVRTSSLAPPIDRALGSVPIIAEVDASRWQTIEQAVQRVSPAIVLNCIGIVKQLKEANDSLHAIEINALFLHRLAQLARRYRFRLIHFSTDCVFSGFKGNYSEDDVPDPQDLYGRT